MSAMVIIIIATFAGALAGTAAGCIMASGGRDDAFRAGYQAGRVAQFEDDFKWGGNEGAVDPEDAFWTQRPEHRRASDE